MPDPPDTSMFNSEILRRRRPKRPPRFIEQYQRGRFVQVLGLSAVAGVLLAVTQAPFWMGIVVVGPLVTFGVPYVMLKRVPDDDD